MIRLFLAIGILIGYISGLGFIYLGVVAATIGFWLTMVGLLLVWAFVLYTGFLFLEVCAAQPLGADIPSITKKYLESVYKLKINLLAFLNISLVIPI